jgi:hypothetical protein
MKLTKNEFNTLRSEIETALASVAAKYGCIVEAGNIKYDAINTTVSVSFKSETPDKSADQLNFETYCGSYGFDKEDFGFTFTYQSKQYRFVSFKTSARKYPCVCECSDGKTVCFTVEAIRTFMIAERRP